MMEGYAVKWYTFKGARRLYNSFEEAKEEARGKLVRAFVWRLDGLQWLFACEEERKRQEAKRARCKEFVLFGNVVRFK